MIARQRKILSYGVAAVMTASALFLRGLLTPLWGLSLPFLTFYPAVMVASWYGGFGAGLLASLLSAFSALYFFILPAHPGSLPASDLVGLLFFTVINILIAYLNEKLHQAVRRAEAHADLLEKSEEQMREAERKKDEFLAMLGHELRTPLNNLAGGIHLLRSSPNDEDIRLRSIEVIDRQFRHMTRIVGDLLDISRIGQGKLQLENERLDLCILARETIEDFCRTLEKNVTVCIEAPEIPLAVKGDRTRIAQMLTNLLQNSAKFTNANGRITIRIALDIEEKQVVVSVADTGIGIEPELLPRLFSIYTQSRQTTSSEGGLGLGLAIVKSLAELQGGRVEAFSQGKGRGAEVRFRLPLTEVPTAAPILRETMIVPSRQSAQRRASKSSS